jgi:branched-chain amino acid transport system substrate-binding protein
MKKQMVLAIIVAVLTGFLVMPQVVFGAQTLKVGVVDTYSGPAAPMGIDNLNGLKMAVNAFNAKGGANDTTIDLVTRDDKFKPDIALAMAKDLILKEKVAVLVGTISSSCSLRKERRFPSSIQDPKVKKLRGRKATGMSSPWMRTR